MTPKPSFYLLGTSPSKNFFLKKIFVPNFSLLEIPGGCASAPFAVDVFAVVVVDVVAAKNTFLVIKNCQCKKDLYSRMFSRQLMK